MRWAYEHCWYKKRANSRLTRSTYNKWIKNFKARGHYAPGKRVPDMSVQPWHALAVELRRRPQGSTYTWIHEQIKQQWNPAWGKPPSYHMVDRFFTKQFSQIDQTKGRYTGSQLRSHKFYQHRTAEGLAPGDLIHADGWNTHFTAPHPITGEFVTYEVWHFHDVATRYVPPPGIGLTEKFEVIAKGLENCIRVLGQVATLQTDSTKVVRGSARFTKDPVRSLEELLGMTVIHPKEVGNSQANGIAENFNNSYLDKRSRELATYQNKKSMDDLTFKRVKKLTAQMVKAANSGDLMQREQTKREIMRMGKGLVFDSHHEAVEWINRIHDEFNDKPHRALKKLRDPNTGRMRHQTPREALNEHKANGWEPLLLDEAQLVDIFRPRVVVKVTRETVSPYGGMRYRNPDVLGHYNGQNVVVAYDIHDFSRVWVSDMKGALICLAEFVGATGYIAKTAQESADEKRALARIRLREKQIEQIRAEVPGMVIENKPGDGLITVDFPAVEREAELLTIDIEPLNKPEELGSYAETMMMLYGEEDFSGESSPVNEVAAL